MFEMTDLEISLLEDKVDRIVTKIFDIHECPLGTWSWNRHDGKFSLKNNYSDTGEHPYVYYETDGVDKHLFRIDGRGACHTLQYGFPREWILMPFKKVKKEIRHGLIRHLAFEKNDKLQKELHEKMERKKID